MYRVLLFLLQPQLQTASEGPAPRGYRRCDIPCELALRSRPNTIDAALIRLLKMSPIGGVLFLKDEPLLYEDSGKEIPVSCKVIIVDDAHRQENLGRVLQLIHDRRQHHDLKLILSTRPGSATRLAQQVAWFVDRTEVTEVPELKELTCEESLQLAQQVLGPDFDRYASHLAEIGSNSPLVIVAGGRLIAERRIDPTKLTTLQEFRSTIFTRLLSEMDLQGTQFPIDAHSVLHLVAALGPIDVEK